MQSGTDESESVMDRFMADAVSVMVDTEERAEDSKTDKEKSTCS